MSHTTRAAKSSGMFTILSETQTRPRREQDRRLDDMTDEPTTSRSSADDARKDTDKLFERLAYLDLSAADQERLRELAPKFKTFSAELVEAFYRHLFSFPESARFLSDPKLVERLKQLQLEHFVSLLQADWGPEYFERRRRVGQTHASVGIDPELFLGAYSQYVQQSFHRYLTADGATVPPQLEGLLSLLKVVFLDLGLTLDAYFTRATQTMQQALDMYWKANTELRQFAHLASHDLKTPLATVANFCDEALDEFGERMPAEAKQLIESARARTFRMSTMIDELLSTVTSFDLSKQLQEVSSQTALNEAVDRLRPAILAKQLVLETPKSLPIVWGDAVRLRESFYNLLSNAVKYIERSPGHIKISVRPHAEGFEFVFRDDGPGIPQEELDLIFAPFRRSAKHRAQPGSGLGLYFTKTMIEHQEGRVWAESEPGVGSSFHVVLRSPPSDDAEPVV
jgi:signal transduction histidine kinase